ncbi:hypothetical protein EVAR_56274_1 [Eumeta japonica]|uniref:MADF domain-containing protein n=1 Tax=Eumeta variegata TaxID=151549 RepID=A0A4C1YI76_EUMVA|nr:hypothetical protein EVAR_56274_1 [Eumeta japonica]
MKLLVKSERKSDSRSEDCLRNLSRGRNRNWIKIRISSGDGLRNRAGVEFELGMRKVVRTGKWKKLRDSHREALRRRKVKVGSSDGCMRPWKYEKQMSFLLPLMGLRSHSLTEEMTSVNFPEASVNFPEVSELESEVSEASQIDEQADAATDQREAYANSKAFFKMIRERESRQAAVDSSRMQHRDPLDDLFSSLCAKTKALPKYLQLRVQREIFTSVSRAEEEAMLNEDSNIFIASHHPKSSPAHSLATDSP